MSTVAVVEKCPACEEGRLRRKAYERLVEHRGVSGHIQQFKRTCDHCGIDLFDEQTARENKRAWVSFQKQVDGVPIGEQIRAMRKLIGLTSEQAGELLGGGPKAFSKYENDELVPSGAMRTMLNYLLRYPERINDVLKANGKPPAKTRIRVNDVLKARGKPPIGIRVNDAMKYRTLGDYSAGANDAVTVVMLHERKEAIASPGHFYRTRSGYDDVNIAVPEQAAEIYQ